MTTPKTRAFFHRIVAICIIMGALPQAAYARQVIVIRHGEAENNVQHLLSSHPGSPTDLPLTAKGVQQVEAAATAMDKVVSHKQDVVMYASPMKRTQQTAEVLRAALNIPKKQLLTEPSLVEIDMGALDGKSETGPEHAKYYPDPGSWDNSRAHAYGGETSADVQQRLCHFVEHLQATAAATPIIVVTHGTPMLELLHLFENPLAPAWHPANAEFVATELRQVNCAAMFYDSTPAN